VLRAARHPVLAVALALALAGLLFEAGTAIVASPGAAVDRFADSWVYTAVELMAVVMCATRTVRRRADRTAWALITLSLAFWTAGDLIWTLWLDQLAHPPSPSAADVAYLLSYPALYAGLVLLVRARLRSTSAAEWLDGAVVGLTVAAVAAALVLSTVLANRSGRFWPDVVNLAYPCGDFIVLSLVAAGCMWARRPSRVWLLLSGAVITTAIADIVSVYEVATSSYVAGTLLDVFWPAAMTLVAFAAWASEPRRPRHRLAVRHTIVITLLAAAVALGLLVVAAFARLTPLAVGLAAAALVVATVRAGLTYLENVSMLRRRDRDAMTDALSGLGNRRALMADLDHAIAECAQDGAVHTLAFFDLNGFKRYNDTFGHGAGDALLSRLGRALAAGVQDAGRAYRLGGDEFCALLHGRLAPGARAIAAARSALHEDGTVVTVSTAVGLAVIPDDATTASAALRLADERMYADKAHASRAEARAVLIQVLNERTPGLLAHVAGVTELVSAVARGLALDPEAVDEVLRAAEMHDIGKLAIPDEILDKPGPLDEAEREFMRQHPVIGERILGAAPALGPVAKLVRSSHERWDGGGYPDGLAGEAIPLGARIVAVCDAYEAMISERCYQRARSREDAVEELRRNAGTQFDPRVVDALCRCLPELPASAVVGAARG